MAFAEGERPATRVLQFQKGINVLRTYISRKGLTTLCACTLAGVGVGLLYAATNGWRVSILPASKWGFETLVGDGPSSVTTVKTVGPLAFRRTLPR